MNDDQLEGTLRRAGRARPSLDLDRRMRALFDAGAARRWWVLPLRRPVPGWVLATACILSAAGGFLANSLLLGHPDPVPRGRPATLAICMLEPDRPLARRFLGPAGSEMPQRLADWRLEVQTTDTAKSPTPQKEEPHP